MNTLAESELKYAAQEALRWMNGAIKMPELAPWVDPVVIDMLTFAIARSKAEAIIPSNPNKICIDLS